MTSLRCQPLADFFYKLDKKYVQTSRVTQLERKYLMLRSSFIHRISTASLLVVHLAVFTT